jgi:hypothetical protein
VEDVYRHTSGAHRALAFPDFLGLLIGLGLEEYRKRNPAPPEGEQREALDIKDEPEEEGGEAALRLLGLAPGSLPDLFREFDEAMGPPPPVRPFRLVRSGKNIGEA